MLRWRHVSAQVFEQGALYDPKVLDIKEDDLMDAVSIAITRIAAASLELSYPTLASIPHSIVNGYKNVLAVSVATDYDFPLAEKVNARRLPVLARLVTRISCGAPALSLVEPNCLNCMQSRCGVFQLRGGLLQKLQSSNHLNRLTWIAGSATVGNPTLQAC